MTVKLYGYGWIGKILHAVFPDAVIQDPALGFVTDQVCDVGFIAVPTMLLESGLLDTSIVEDIVSKSKEDLLIIRSAVNPGDCDRWENIYDKNIVNMPEYLGETAAHPLLDETKAKFLVIGGRPESRRKAIELFQSVYNANTTIRQVSNLEAEVIKLSENRAIAFKVAECQELFDACEAAGVDYYTIREVVYHDDPRMNLWWTFIYKEQRGFHNSKCLQKDPQAWCIWALNNGINPKVTQAIIDRSLEYAQHSNT